ncbi:dihydrofolate reductase [Mycoplasmatota bacterium zrk1]
MISIIVAHDKNLLIGKDNQLPWHYGEDLKYFKRITLGKNVLMGSSTLNSIISYLGRPLPDRHTLLLTRGKESDYDVEVVNSVDEVLEKYKHSEVELFICGGKSVYEQFLPFADKLYITHIDKEYQGDTYFPRYNINEWEKVFERVDGVLNFSVYKRIIL